MAALDPDSLALLASTTGIGFLMILSGMQKNALEWKSRRRRCPSCGRHVRSGSCGCTPV